VTKLSFAVSQLSQPAKTSGTIPGRVPRDPLRSRGLSAIRSHLAESAKYLLVKAYFLVFLNNTTKYYQYNGRNHLFELRSSADTPFSYGEHPQQPPPARTLD